jgi:hypothetical protein
VIQWQRQGFRLFWRWQLQAGRPSVAREVRELSTQMRRANPLWSAPRIHGELLKVGIELGNFAAIRAGDSAVPALLGFFKCVVSSG